MASTKWNDTSFSGKYFCSIYWGSPYGGDGQEIINPENRRWFSIALERLVNITSDGFHLFEGTPRKLRIVSNRICYGPCPEPDDEIEQGSTNQEYSEQLSIQVGDFVYVPSGKDNHESLVEVVDIEYFSREEVPLPLEKVKSILRKNMGG